MTTRSSPIKRASMTTSVSVADRAKQFQSAASAPAMPHKNIVRKSVSPMSSPLLPSEEAESSSSTPVALIKHARRISVATPIHRRARSDVSILDPHLSQDTSFAQIEELTAKLEATRPLTLHRRSGSHANALALGDRRTHLRSSSTDTVRGTHASFEVSPALSDDGSIDWHHFVTSNYGNPAAFDLRQPISSLRDLTLPEGARKRLGYDSKAALGAKADSPTLNDEATWLEEELARCSSDEDELEGDLSYEGEGEEYATPEGSPLLSPVDLLAMQEVEVMGLGIQAPSLSLPGKQKEPDSLLEQVAMHEACIQTLRSISIPPPRQSSLAIPSIGEDYDSSLSPMADLGHSSPGERRASAASYASTDSTVSGDISIGSHGSSLLYNRHLAAPRMERLGSADTVLSTRSATLANTGPVKPARSPMRMNMPLPPVPQATQERMKVMPLPPLPHEVEKARLVRKASRRKEGTEQPLLPVRSDSLLNDDAVRVALESFSGSSFDKVAETLTLDAPAPHDKGSKKAEGSSNLTPADIPAYPGSRKSRGGLQPSPSLKLKSKLSFGLSYTNDAPYSSPPTTTPFKPTVLDRFRKASSTRGESDRARLSSSAALAAAEFPAAWKDKIGSFRPSMDMRRPSVSSLAPSSTSTSGRGGLKKMLSSITGTAGERVNVGELAASTFESPTTPRRKAGTVRGEESFMELSDDEPISPIRARGMGRKDLTKMFGASEADLIMPVSPTSVVSQDKGWKVGKGKGSLGRAGSKKVAAGRR